MIIPAVAVACNDWLARHRWHLGRGPAFSVLLVEIAPVDRQDPGRCYPVRPLLFPGFHPIASFEASLVGLAAGGGVKVNVGAVPVLGKVLQSAVKVFGRELEDVEPEGGGMAAEPPERLFSAALKAWKMRAAARPRCGFRGGTLNSRLHT